MTRMWFVNKVRVTPTCYANIFLNRLQAEFVCVAFEMRTTAGRAETSLPPRKTSLLHLLPCPRPLVFRQVGGIGLSGLLFWPFSIFVWDSCFCCDCTVRVTSQKKATWWSCVCPEKGGQCFLTLDRLTWPPEKTVQHRGSCGYTNKQSAKAEQPCDNGGGGWPPFSSLVFGFQGKGAIVAI